MSSIYDDSVLIQVPSGYGVGKLYSVIPNTPVGDFDVTRSSWTTRVNKYGYIENVVANVPRLNYDSGVVCPYLLTEDAGTNIITYPISFGDDYWIKSGASIEGDSTLTLTGTDVASGWDFTSGWTTGGTATIDSATSFTLNAASDYVNKKYNTLTGDAVLLRIVGTKDGGTLSIKDKDGTSGSTYAITDNSFDVTFWMNYESSREPIMFEAADALVGQVNITTMECYEAQGFEAPKVLPVANGAELVDDVSDYGVPSGYNNTVNISSTSSFESTYVSSENRVYYNLTTVVGKTYKLSYSIATSTTGMDVYIKENANGTGSLIASLSQSTGIVTLYFTATTTTASVTWTGADDYSLTTISVKEITTCSWSGGGFEKEAYKLVEDTSSGSHTVRKTSGLTITSGVDVTFSVYAKKGERNWIAFSNDYGSGLSGWFDLENGVWGQVNNATANSKELANGWYRLSLTATSSSTSAQVRIYATTSDGNYTYTGDGTSGLYIAYAQLEENDYASSLMLPANSVEGSTTSRVADEITGAGDASLFSGVNSSGVLFLNIAALSDDLVYNSIAISDGTTQNRIVIQYTSTTNQINGALVVGNSTQANSSYSVTDITEFSKVGFRWAENDFSLWIDGVERVTDTSGSTFPASTLTVLNFTDGFTGNPFYAKTKALGVFDYLYDDQMELLTGDSYATYEALAMAEDYIIL
jgi:hypothetical protein